MAAARAGNKQIGMPAAGSEPGRRRASKATPANQVHAATVDGERSSSKERLFWFLRLCLSRNPCPPSVPLSSSGAHVFFSFSDTPLPPPFSLSVSLACSRSLTCTRSPTRYSSCPLSRSLALPLAFSPARSPSRSLSRSLTRPSSPSPSPSPSPSLTHACSRTRSSTVACSFVHLLMSRLKTKDCCRAYLHFLSCCRELSHSPDRFRVIHQHQFVLLLSHSFVRVLGLIHAHAHTHAHTHVHTHPCVCKGDTAHSFVRVNVT